MQAIAEVWLSHGETEPGSEAWFSQFKAFNEACEKFVYPGFQMEVHLAAITHIESRDQEAKAYFVERMSEVQNIASKQIREIRMKELSRQIQDFYSGREIARSPK